MTTKAKGDELTADEARELAELEKLAEAEESKGEPQDGQPQPPTQADLLFELWEAIDEQMRNWKHDEPNYRVRDVLRRLGPFPTKEEAKQATEPAEEPAGSEA